MVNDFIKLVLENVEIGQVARYDCIFNVLDLVCILFWNVRKRDFLDLLNECLALALTKVVIETADDSVEVLDFVLKDDDFFCFFCDEFVT